mmetsp:Transcript_50107/g.108896  ORF Transcript_50107/g.108896 Transcript_50107/m.108896 type:complete len:133 (+) Transcript_50107:198-596(+)
MMTFGYEETPHFPTPALISAQTISSEAPVVFAKACELFVHELTIRAWMHAELHGRQVLVKKDIVNAIARTPSLSFVDGFLQEDGDTQVRQRPVALTFSQEEDGGFDAEAAHIDPTLWFETVTSSREASPFAN